MIDLGFITGVMVGFELYDDNEEECTSLILDLFIVRVVFTWWK